MTSSRKPDVRMSGSDRSREKAPSGPERSYRSEALRILPWICARCGREFSGRKLRELTVHHRDHNHANNPPDGSNWELLCLYCHEEEHSRGGTGEAYSGSEPGGATGVSSTYRPFAGLGELLRRR